LFLNYVCPHQLTRELLKLQMDQDTRTAATEHCILSVPSTHRYRT
jgi:hypothetical protein